VPDAASAKVIIARFHEAACKYDVDQERAIMEPVWNVMESTDKGLRTCIVENSNGVIAALRVKRRLREQVSNEVAAIASASYSRARYLLGTGAAQPSYSQSAADSERNAFLINQRSDAYGFKELLWSLDGGNNVLMDVVRQMQLSSPLLGALGKDAGIAAFLGAYTFGIACALAEDELYGPLG
jgi:hypothetical protein